MGTVPPREGFLEGFRSLCTDEGIVLIFYRELQEKSARLSSGIAEAAKKAAFPIYSTRVGSMLRAFF
jgi:glutamate-1-semialdehyde aminotransferase